jgi:hypothetical protein
MRETEASDPRSPPATLVPISPPECWRLLAEAPIGRLGVLSRHAPEIYPINHEVDDRTIVFRLGRSDALFALSLHPRAAFEVDGIDLDRRTGWSVLVKGVVEILDVPDPRRPPVPRPPKPWPGGPRDRWIRLVPAEVTGRRIHRPGAARAPSEAAGDDG